MPLRWKSSRRTAKYYTAISYAFTFPIPTTVSKQNKKREKNNARIYKLKIKTFYIFVLPSDNSINQNRIDEYELKINYFSKTRSSPPIERIDRTIG